MSSHEDWREVIDALSVSPAPLRCPAMARLYALALKAAHDALRSHGPSVREQVEDLVHDKLFACLEDLLKASNPRGLFVTAIRRAAIDLVRRARRFDHDDETPGDHLSDPAPRADDAITSREELNALLAPLSARDREVILAAAQGCDREELAAAFGTSRANIDQIVSRVRRRSGRNP